MHMYYTLYRTERQGQSRVSSTKIDNPPALDSPFSTAANTLLGVKIELLLHFGK